MIFYDTNRKLTNTEVGPEWFVVVVVKNQTMLFVCCLFFILFLEMWKTVELWTKKQNLLNCVSRA